MTLQEVKENYNFDITQSSNKLAVLKKRIFRIGSLRLIVVSICIIVCYLAWGDSLAVVATIVVSLVIFLFLLKYHNRLFYSKKYCELQIKNALDELNALKYNFSAFDGAPERVDASHSFSFDLDVFGERSFFQSINRTISSFSKDNLSQMICNPCQNKKAILLRQGAIQELSQKQEFLFHFCACGQMSEM